MYSFPEIVQSCLPPNKLIRLASLPHVLNCHYSSPQLSNYMSPPHKPVMSLKLQSAGSMLATLISSHSVREPKSYAE